MLSNFLLGAARNMARHRFFTAMVISGLGASFAVAILIGVFVHDRLHSEAFVPDSKLIALIGTQTALKDQPSYSVPASAPELAELIRQNHSRVRRVTRRYQTTMSVSQEDTTGTELVNWVDPNFFSVFRLRVLRGNLHDALSLPESAVVTKRFAQKYFGTDDVVGKTLELNDVSTVQIAAILDDLPTSTTLTGNLYVSSAGSASPIAQLEAARASQPIKLLPDNALTTYIMVSEPNDLPLLEQEFANSEKLQSSVPEVITFKFLPVALNDLHLQMPGQHDTSKTMVLGVSLVGIMVLLVAGINFVNLMTARAADRAREIGIRKSLGAGRHHLIGQFMGESALYVGLSLLLALVLVELFSPVLMSFLFQAVDLESYRGLLTEIFLFALLFTLLAGAYPSLVLSAFRPQSALKGGPIGPSGSMVVRQSLVALQFAFLVAIVIATLVVDKQIRFATHEVLKSDSAQVLMFETRCPGSLVAEIRKLSGVEAQFCSSVAPLGQSSFTTTAAGSPDGRLVSLSALEVDSGFFNFYDVRPLAGRLLADDIGGAHESGEGPVQSPDLSGSTRRPVSIVINERARKRLGLDSPNEALGQLVKNVLPDGKDGQVVGVVPDFVIGPVYEETQPIVFFVDSKAFQRMLVKISRKSIPETVTAIEKLWAEQNGDVPLAAQFMNLVYESIYRDTILEARAFSSMAVIALITAGLGLLALSVYSAEAKKKEIGVRKALGASRAQITLMLGTQILSPVLWSNLIAWPAAYFLMKHWLEGFAYRADLTVATFLAGSLIALMIGSGTVFLHSWRAARVNPSDLLKYE